MATSSFKLAPDMAAKVAAYFELKTLMDTEIEPARRAKSADCTAAGLALDKALQDVFDAIDANESDAVLKDKTKARREAKVASAKAEEAYEKVRLISNRMRGDIVNKRLEIERALQDALIGHLRTGFFAEDPSCRGSEVG